MCKKICRAFVFLPQSTSNPLRISQNLSGAANLFLSLYFKWIEKLECLLALAIGLAMKWTKFACKVLSSHCSQMQLLHAALCQEWVFAHYAVGGSFFMQQRPLLPRNRSLSTKCPGQRFNFPGTHNQARPNQLEETGAKLVSYQNTALQVLEEEMELSKVHLPQLQPIQTRNRKASNVPVSPCYSFFREQ